jgi:hypothetical protein
MRGLILIKFFDQKEEKKKDLLFCGFSIFLANKSKNRKTNQQCQLDTQEIEAR